MGGGHHKHRETRTSDKLQLPRAYTNQEWGCEVETEKKNRNGKTHLTPQRQHCYPEICL